MTKEGLNAGEKVVDSAGASLLTGTKKEYGLEMEQWIKGELVLTQNSVVFLEPTGFFKTGRRRHHAISLEGIAGTHIENRGITGALTGEAFLVLEVRSGQQRAVERYSCHSGDAERLSKKINSYLEDVGAREKLRSELLRLIKPKGEVELKEISQQPTILAIVSKLKNRAVTDISQKETYGLVVNEVQTLISEGSLDGIIDDEGKFISSLMLSRKSVQYQITIDFTNLYSQLKNKGIVLETLECPSCSAKLEYPEDGSVFSCKYCGASISAVDVFEKFKAFLDI